MFQIVPIRRVRRVRSFSHFHLESKWLFWMPPQGCAVQHKLPQIMKPTKNFSTTELFHRDDSWGIPNDSFICHTKKWLSKDIDFNLQHHDDIMVMYKRNANTVAKNKISCLISSIFKSKRNLIFSRILQFKSAIFG